jgi:hypothetical protein
MHFDERLDEAISKKQFGDRQRFVWSNQSDAYKDSTVRLFIVDTLTVCFRTHDGTVRCTNLRGLRQELWHVFKRSQTVLTTGRFNLVALWQTSAAPLSTRRCLAAEADTVRRSRNGCYPLLETASVAAEHQELESKGRQQMTG